MLLGVTGFLLVVPFLTALVEAMPLPGMGMAPWYAFLVLWPPLLPAWCWIHFRWRGAPWAEIVTYFLVCAAGTVLAFTQSSVQAFAATGAFYLVPLVGVFYRRWGLVVLGGGLGVAFVVVWFGFIVAALPGPLQGSAAALAYADAVLLAMSGFLNALVAHVLEQRERAILAERARTAEQERRYRLLAENSADLVTVHDAAGILSYVSPSCEGLLGYAPADLEGRNLLSLCHPEDVRQIEFSLQAASRGRPTRVVYRLQHRDGSYSCYETLTRPVPGAEDDEVRLQSAARDITHRKALEDQLSHQAFHDPLTGLPNRVLLLERAEQALRRARGRPDRMAILFVDLDNFKNVNDSLGHPEGDRLLVAFAERAVGLVRPEDTLARLGGDEFAIVLEAAGAEALATALAERLKAGMEQPFAVSGRPVFVTLSTGIVANASRHLSAENLMRDADAAMYVAKNNGKAQYRLFDPRMAELAASRLLLDTDLRGALEHGEFLLHYQPIVAIGSRLPVGFEALLRWQHPQRGLLPPIDFVPLAEANGMIVPIGRWVLAEACRQLRDWTAGPAAGASMFMSVNLSPLQLESADLVDAVREVLRETGLPPRSLQIEITESTLLSSGEATASALQGLRDLGVRMVIDDFGTGFANLAYLQKVKVDALKIDRSFVARLAQDPEDMAIVRSLISLARDLHIEVTGEGIETEEQRRHLEAFECAHGQGYLFSRPVPAEEAEAYLLAAIGGG